MANKPIPENESIPENQSESDNILWYITSNVDLSKKMEKEIRLALIKRDLHNKYDGLKTLAEIEAMYERSITHLDSQGNPKKFKPKSVSRKGKKKKSKKKSKKKRNKNKTENK